MVIISTRAVEVSIHAVSPALILSLATSTGSVGAGGAAGAAAAGAAAAGAVAASAGLASSAKLGTEKPSTAHRARSIGIFLIMTFPLQPPPPGLAAPSSNHFLA